MIDWISNQLALGERIGIGGMAEVFRALQIQPGGFLRQVAVKRLLPCHSKTREAVRAQFDREARLYGRLNHPNIVQVFSTIERSDELLMVMEYISGKTILEVWSKFTAQSKKVPLEFAVYIAREACAALAYADALVDPETGNPLHVVHRDISPQNIMITYGGRVKVLDFGIAKVRDQTAMTKTGVLKGKLRYLAPESIQRGTVDHRSDIYALGVLLWEMLADREFVEGDFAPDAMQEIVSGPIPSIADYRPELPKTVDLILQTALAKDPEERYQLAADFARDLDNLLSRCPEVTRAENAGELVKNMFAAHYEQDRGNEQQLRTAARRDLRGRPLRRICAKLAVIVNPRRVLLPFGWPIKAALAAALLIFNVLHFAEKSLASSAAELSPLAFFSDVTAWYRVDAVGSKQGKPVTRWRDRSPHHFDAVQEDPDSQPKLNYSAESDQPVMHFDGKHSYFTAPAIAAAISKSRGFTVILTGSVHGNDTHYFWASQFADRSTDIARIGGHFGSILFMKSTSVPGAIYDTSKPVDLKKLAVLSFVMDHGSARMFRNGEMIIERELDTSPDLAASALFSIGQKYNFGDPSYFLDGDIGEFLFFDHALNEESRKSTEKYLGQKFGITLANSQSQK